MPKPLIEAHGKNIRKRHGTDLDANQLRSSAEHFEEFIRGQLASGGYHSASEVLRDALRLLEERERRLMSLDASLARGLADIETGRVYEADEVFGELDARYSRSMEERREP